LTIRNQNSKNSPHYISYLLRLWRVKDDDEPHPPEKAVWRASLEDPNTRERKAFASLDDLVEYLQERTGQVTGGQAASDVDEVSKRKGGRP
jgi:hypothetical protein